MSARIEDCLDQNNVRAAVDKALDLLLVGRHHLVPRAVTEARVLDRGRDGESTVGGAHGSGDEAGAVGLLRGDLLGRIDSELASDLVEIVDDVLQAVIGLRGNVRGVSVKRPRRRCRWAGGRAGGWEAMPAR